MNYLRVLTFRWSRQDWLAVFVVALVGALLVGTTLLVVSAGEQTSALATEFEANGTVSHYDSPETAHETAGENAVVLPTAVATNDAGESTRVVGIPNASASFDLPPPPARGVGPVTEREEWVLVGDTTNETVAVTPGGESGLLPPSWIRVSAETLEPPGATGALVLTQAETSEDGAPLVSVLSFFTSGTEDVLGLLWSGVAIASLVVAVTVSAVVRLLITARARTIRVARATGAPPRRIQLPLATRATLLTLTGALFGYAIGVIVSNIAVNVAVFLGFPTTLSLQVTPRVAALLCGILAVVTVVGGISGYLTARAGTTGPVAQVTQESVGSRIERVPTAVRALCRPTFLAPRTLVPTTATLSAFVLIVLLVTSLGAVGGSLTTDTTTVSQPDAPHPVASQIPESYAGAIAGPDIAASPEILLFGHSGGKPYLARGGEYEQFAAVTGAEITAGRAPSASDEAVVGTAAAKTLDLDPGETLTMGGSTDAGIAQLTVVGVYDAGGLDDHQVLVSLPIARHLSTVQEGNVNVIRTSGTVSVDENATSPVVLGIDTTRYTTPEAPLVFDATVWNPRDTRVERNVSAVLGESRVTKTVTLQPRERMTVEFSLPTPATGEYDLSVGSVTQPVTVTTELPITLTAPTKAPPGEPLQVRIRDSEGTPVANGTVILGEETRAVDTTGAVWIEPPEQEGRYELSFRRNDQVTRTEIQVTAGATQSLLAAVSVTPSTPTVYARPTAESTLRNPWNRSTEATVEIAGPGVAVVEQITVGPGEQRELSTALARRPPGEYTVRVSVADRVVATEQYRVTGDERLGAALASSGHYGGSGGLGNAIEYAVGNLSVLLSALVGLAAVTIVGALIAVLARAIRDRSHAIGIYRATGASPGRIVRLVVADAIRIGVVSSVFALILATGVVEGLARVGRLTAFGISLDPLPSLRLAALVFLGTVALTVLAAVVLTLGIVRMPVHRLLSGTRQPTPTEKDLPNSTPDEQAPSRSPDGQGSNT